MANKINVVAGTDVPLRFVVRETDVYGTTELVDLTGAYCYFEVHDSDGNTLLTLDNDPAGANVGVTIPTQTDPDLGAFNVAIGDQDLIAAAGGKHQFFTLVRLDPGGQDVRSEPARGLFCLESQGVGGGGNLASPINTFTLAELNARITDADLAISALPDIFTQQNISASQLDVQLSRLTSTSFTEVKAVRAGSIVGMSTRLSEAVTDATVDSAIVTATINGSPATIAISHSSGVNPSGGEATQAPGIDTYVAGDLLGVQITTLGSFLPISSDIEAYLEILH